MENCEDCKRYRTALDAIWRESDGTPEFSGDKKEGWLNSDSLTNVAEMARNALDGKELNP